MTPQEKKIVSLRRQLGKAKDKLAATLEVVRNMDGKLAKSQRRIDSLAKQYATMIGVDKAKADPKYENKLKQTIDYFVGQRQVIVPVAEAARAAVAQDIQRDVQNRRMNRPIRRAGQPPMARMNQRGRWPVAPPPRFAQAFRRIVNPHEPPPQAPQEVLGMGWAQQALQDAGVRPEAQARVFVPDPWNEQQLRAEPIVQERGVDEGWQVEPG